MITSIAIIEKQCIKCKLFKPKDSFYKQKTECRTCASIYQKSYRLSPKGQKTQKYYYLKHKDKIDQAAKNRVKRLKGTIHYELARKLTNRKEKLKSRFKITVEEYDKLLKEQGNKCQICKTETTNNKRFKRLVIDHDHNTGFIRGLLCHTCNSGLGSFKDKPALLVTAVEYLKISQEKQASSPKFNSF